EFNWGNDPTLTEDLFIGCTFDQPLQIPEGFTTTNNAFRFATFNKSLTFPVTFTKLSNQEFYGCTFNEGIILPNEITDIPDNCFAKATFKKRLLLPESLKNINFRSFAYAKLDSGLIMNNNLKTIGSESFSHMICKGKFITAPKATIDPTAFGYSEIDSMQFTGSYFNGLGTMSELDYDYENPKYKFSIKIKVLDLGLSTPSNESFNYIGLSEVYTHRTTPPTVERLFTPILLLFDNRYDATLWVPYGSKLLYENTEPWSFFSRIKVFGDIKPGDVNGDYSVNIKDLTFLINSVLDGGSDDMLDVNNDGTVDVKDVTALINLILE
ncbi:MAG: leucine-rich repeat protein, partial [Muribaculaceae bacterium]|nr:leucine-rich repeat protein [Muribaculaceae bacterium]